MRRELCATVLLCSAIAFAQHDHHATAPQSQAILLEGVGEIHHPVSTKNAEAQKFFDQGLALLYGFNHDEAERSFRRAAELDPKLAMAWWGVALVNGKNYNMPSMADREKAAYAALQKAQALIAHASPKEKAYINALSKRYSADPNADTHALEVAYSAAMKEVMQRYPDDLDAATLYAESMMNQRPWALWNHDGTPAPGTEEIVRVLESVLRRNPRHSGANHYHIHAVEASHSPEKGLASAHRLREVAPAIGHLVHMPTHIYFRVGDFDEAAKINLDAAEADRRYIARTRATGVYPAMYYPHNIHFEALAHFMAGRFADAMRATDQLDRHVEPLLKEMPMLESFLVTRGQVLQGFNRWKEILALPQPPAERQFQRAHRHYLRGFALASTGKTAEAEKELATLKQLRAKIPADMMSAQNPVAMLLGIGEHALTARIAQAKGDFATAERELAAGIQVQDNLKYIEPPEWPNRLREQLGAVLYAQRKYAEAERVFRDDLARSPRNGRALYGLAVSLKAQQKTESATSVMKEFEASWQKSDTPMTLALIGIEESAIAVAK